MNNSQADTSQKALNIFNAALVTPTYYVYFTSATIVASAVLFQGFKGTAVSISTVVMGFLVICVGVVLLQLAKSSKDVPETEVFKGEIDQIRTIAEQEEPEYEPRADTIRGGAAIVRALSRTRTKRQAKEAHRIHEERMEAIGENETVEWDGLKRRKTTSTASGSIKRSNTVHPPLGMSHMPTEDSDSEPEEDMHPGFFSRLGRKMTTAAGGHRKASGHSPVPMASVNIHPKRTSSDDHDTAYHSPGPSGAGGPHLRWAGAEEPDRSSSRGSSLAPRPPPHVLPPTTSSSSGPEGKRQFSFHNVFTRSRSGTGATSLTAPDDEHRPVSRGALSFVRGGRANASTTEEERLGLVHGDSGKGIPEGDDEDRRDSDEWQMASGAESSSPEIVGASPPQGGDLGYASAPGGMGRGRRDPYGDYEEDEFDMARRSPRTSFGGRSRDSGGGGGAFV